MAGSPIGRPWDRPPIPTRANKSASALYEAIGRALEAWENVEVSLSSLYAALTGRARFNRAAYREYGEPLNFSGRKRLLEQAAERYFIQHPCQTTEGDFQSLMESVTGYAERRNDIAHGIVTALHMARNKHATILGDGSPLHWCLVPPRFKETKHS